MRFLSSHESHTKKILPDKINYPNLVYIPHGQDDMSKRTEF